MLFSYYTHIYKHAHSRHQWCDERVTCTQHTDIDTHTSSAYLFDTATNKRKSHVISTQRFLSLSFYLLQMKVLQLVFTYFFCHSDLSLPLSFLFLFEFFFLDSLLFVPFPFDEMEFVECEHRKIRAYYE